VNLLICKEGDLQRGSGLVGSHLRSDRFYGESRKLSATNADGPLGDRTLPPPVTTLSRVAKNSHRRHPDEEFLSPNRWRLPSEALWRKLERLLASPKISGAKALIRFRPIEPLPERLRRRIRFKQTETEGPSRFPAL
jgi:hypothetical protein